MSDRLFPSFGSGSSSSVNHNGSPQQENEDPVIRLLEQHQINRALKKAQLGQQQCELELIFICCKQNEGQSSLRFAIMSQLLPSHGSNNNVSQRSMSLTQHRASMASSGLGNSQQISSASPPVASGHPTTTRSQSSGSSSGVSSNGRPQQEDEDPVIRLLEQHQINRALKKAQLGQQQCEQVLTSFGSSSLFLNKVSRHLNIILLLN